MQHTLNWLRETDPSSSAAGLRLSRTTLVLTGAGMALLYASAFWTPSLVAVSLLFCMIFPPRAALHYASFAYALRPRRHRRVPRITLPAAMLPTYTILLPLRHENMKIVKQLVEAMLALDYPPKKLEVMFLVDADDMQTQIWVRRFARAGHMSLVVVPQGDPKTKPKVCSYALARARGTLTVVYDAEDRPDPGQLRAAAERFANAGPELGCLQARLFIRPGRGSWLQQQFALEYAILFNLILPLMAALKLPILLGGTSNHFRTSLLRKAGGWDPFNITEDAEIGIRLARMGYRVEMLDSATEEEAPRRLAVWLPQRTRWQKGFLQTSLVMRRNWRQWLKELGPVRMAAVIMMLPLPLLGTALLPLVALVIITNLALYSSLLHPETPQALGILYTLVMGLGHGGVIVTSALMGVRDRTWRHLLSAATCPAHWFLVAAACWRAFRQLHCAPYLWEKTPHGDDGDRTSATAAECPCYSGPHPWEKGRALHEGIRSLRQMP